MPSDPLVPGKWRGKWCKWRHAEKSEMHSVIPYADYRDVKILEEGELTVYRIPIDTVIETCQICGTYSWIAGIPRVDKRQRLL